MNTQKLGQKGEKYTIKYLKSIGYLPVYKNYRCAFGEIDIIAETKTFIVFVEVKTRTAGQMLPPASYEDKKKQKRIITSAHNYMSKYKIKKQPRFDIAEVIVNEKGKLSINYLENAFA